MKTLYLLRHAKSSWEDLALRDIDRPLNGRGRAAAAAMGRYLAENGPFPDFVLCSPSVRTQETVRIFLDQVDHDVTVRLDESLYNCGETQVLSAICKAPQDRNALMVVGHYPAMPAVAVALCEPGRGADSEGLRRLARKYPTGALAEIRLNIDLWGNIASRGQCGALQRFVRPKEVQQEA